MKVRRRGGMQSIRMSTELLPPLQQRPANEADDDASKIQSLHSNIHTKMIYKAIAFYIKGIVVTAVALIILLAVLHEVFYYTLLYHWIDLPVASSSSSSSSSPNIAQKTSSNSSSSNATIAIVSLHRGMKFAGTLGYWLTQNKAAYAKQHDYAYFHQSYFASLLVQQQQQQLLYTLDSWQQVYHRRVKFDKLRFLLYICRQFPNLEYILWLDADTVIVEPAVDVRERVAIFDKAFAQQQIATGSSSTHLNDTTMDTRSSNWCFVWAQDMISPNSGVMLLRNTIDLQAFLETSLHTYNPQQRFMDQASMLTALKQQQQQQTTDNNATNQKLSCTPLLLENKSTTANSRLLQSRVRGLPWLLYQPGDWIVHLPNHNRWELVWALYDISKQKKRGT